MELKDLYSKTLETGHDFEKDHPNYSYWVIDWTKPNGLEPEYHRSFAGAWAALMDYASLSKDMMDRGGDGHRVTIIASPRHCRMWDGVTVLSVWEDMEIHKDSGLFLTQF